MSEKRNYHKNFFIIMPGAQSAPGILPFYRVFYITSGAGYSTPNVSTVTVCITCGVSGLS